MSFFRPWMQDRQQLYIQLQDCASVHLPPAEEVEEDWSDLRWGLAQFDTPESRGLLLNLIRAEDVAAEFLDDNIPPDRPEPAWLTDEED